MPSRICIITPTGMICEADSYEYHHTIGHAKKGSKPKCKWIDAPRPRQIKARVAKLIDLAGVKRTPFMIITKP
ncbi:MAG TPA: hypothetical protein VMT21_03585 [Gemmatimonadales bacterium]|nr:hypothetical protein [Gemmatimonadales bacterium]